MILLACNGFNLSIIVKIMDRTSAIESLLWIRIKVQMSMQPGDRKENRASVELACTRLVDAVKGDAYGMKSADRLSELVQEAYLKNRLNPNACLREILALGGDLDKYLKKQPDQNLQ